MGERPGAETGVCKGKSEREEKEKTTPEKRRVVGKLGDEGEWDDRN